MGSSDGGSPKQLPRAIKGHEGKGKLDRSTAAAGSGRGSFLSPCGKQDSFGGIVQVGWRKNSTKVEQTD